MFGKKLFMFGFSDFFPGSSDMAFRHVETLYQDWLTKGKQTLLANNKVCLPFVNQ